MFQGLDTVLALLFITWAVPLVGIIPVLIGWTGIGNSTSQPAVPKALSALTASISMGPVGFVSLIIWSGFRSAKSYDNPPLFVANLFVALLVLGFVLNVIGLVIAAVEKGIARAALLIGSILVAAVNALGFAWLLTTSRGIEVLKIWSVGAG